MPNSKQRKLKAYLLRRRVKNIAEWLSKSGITNLNELQRFCDSSLLSVDLDSYKQYFPSLVKESRPEASLSDGSNDEKADNKTWHVPAAERPIRRASKKKSAPKGKRKKQER